MLLSLFAESEKYHSPAGRISLFRSKKCSGKISHFVTDEIYHCNAGNCEVAGIAPNPPSFAVPAQRLYRIHGINAFVRDRGVTIHTGVEPAVPAHDTHLNAADSLLPRTTYDGARKVHRIRCHMRFCARDENSRLPTNCFENEITEDRSSSLPAGWRCPAAAVPLQSDRRSFAALPH